MTSNLQFETNWEAPGTSAEADLRARRLQISKAKLARVVGLNPSTLSRERISPASRDAFDALLNILSRVTGTAGSERRAVTWLNHVPIIPLGDLPAIEHISNGDAADVMEFLEVAEDGAYS